MKILVFAFVMALCLGAHPCGVSNHEPWEEPPPPDERPLP